MDKYKPFISQIDIDGFLSFNKKTSIELGNLNVIVGPNNSGKSNFLESISFIKSMPNSLPAYISSRGGFSTLINKNMNDKSVNFPKSIKVAFNVNTNVGTQTVRIEVEIEKSIISNYVLLEKMWLNSMKAGLIEPVQSEIQFLNHDSTELKIKDTFIDQLNEFKYSISNEYRKVGLYGATNAKTVDPRIEHSALELIKHPQEHAVLYYVAAKLSNTWINQHIFNSSIRSLVESQSIDGQREFLLEDCSNLLKIMNAMQELPVVWDRFLAILQRFYQGFDDVVISLGQRTISLQVREKGLDAPIPASRMSDGTLKFIALAVLLLQENSPTIIVLEEPEVGLHPDMIHVLAELLIEASKRTQVIVTTHSDLLVSAIGNHDPEAVLICERDEDGTSLRRLKKEHLEEWLNEYSLGELWLKGQLGGTRF